MTKRTRTFLMAAFLVGVSGAAAVADAGGKPPETTSAPAKPPAPAAKAPDSPAKPAMAKIDWASMKKPDRKKYMKAVVLPGAKELFAAYDAKKYKKVTCQTCHGEKRVDDSTYKMPNPEIAKLPTTPDAFKALKAKKPEMVKFMAEEVKPHMAAWLGKPEWTPQNPNGYACFGCHEKM